MKKPRNYQVSAIKQFFLYSKENPQCNGIISAAVGGGKSLINAEICKIILKKKPHLKILCLTHTEDLIDQNRRSLQVQCPEIKTSLYCAGLNEKDLSGQAVFASIQSIHSLDIQEPVTLVTIDECHLCSDKEDSMYRAFLSRLKERNPKLRILGLTGTPYRNKQGLLTEMQNPLFDHIICDISMKYLMDQGYLVRPVVPKVDKILDASRVPTRGDDYISADLQIELDVPEKTDKCVRTLINLTQDKDKILIFTSGVRHAEHVLQSLKQYDQTSDIILGTTQNRKEKLQAFKQGEYKFLVNVATMTTGIDIPDLKGIALMTATKSPVLYTQIIGRGVRPHYKEGFDLTTQQGRLDAIAQSTKPVVEIYDFAGVIETMGAIETLTVAPKNPDKGVGKGFIQSRKVCPQCGEECVVNARICLPCGYLFIENKLEDPTTGIDMMTGVSDPEVIPCMHMTTKAHKKKGADDNHPQTLKVSYTTMYGVINEFIGFEHPEKSFPRNKAIGWHRQREPFEPVPNTAEEAMLLNYAMPDQIKVRKKGKYYEVLDYIFDNNKRIQELEAVDIY